MFLYTWHWFAFDSSTHWLNRWKLCFETTKPFYIHIYINILFKLCIHHLDFGQRSSYSFRQGCANRWFSKFIGYLQKGSALRNDHWTVANRDRQSILKRSQIKSIQYRSALWNDHWTVANRDHQVTLKRSQIKSSIHPAGSFNPGGGWGGGGQLEQASQRHCDSFPRSTGMLIYSTLVFETLCH